MQSITTIDCGYIEPQFACAYLMREGDEALFVENNTAHAVPQLLAALAQQGLRPEQVRYLIITHVHLDHAAGSSALMRACPNATLLAHPRAAKHVIDPSKLVASARLVYGEEQFEKLYGSVEPVPRERVREMADEEELAFGSRTLRFLHTRGHANHHFCIWDSATQGVFTGDSFGLAYPKLQSKGLFIFPSTSPTDFDPQAARASIDRISALNPRVAYLTHFGPITEIKKAAENLKKQLDQSEALLNEITAMKDASESERQDHCLSRLRAIFSKLLQDAQITETNDVTKTLDLDIRLNAQGIVYAANKILQGKST